MLAMFRLIVDPMAALAPPSSRAQTTQGPGSSPTTASAEVDGHDDDVGTAKLSSSKSGDEGGGSIRKTKPTLPPAAERTVSPKKSDGVPFAGKSKLTDWQRYNASHSPVFEWDRSESPPIVQVHLVIDLSSGFVDDKDETATLRVDSASKLLMNGVERSPFTPMVAVTFVQPEGLVSVGIHPRRPSLPLLYLVDWGSMKRDCHRLQLVMEKLESQAFELDSAEEDGIANGITTKQGDEMYTLLLVDLSGSSRQGECEYLRNIEQKEKTTTTTPSSTESASRRIVRLAKRSIVQNRYYDPESKEMHPGELVPNPPSATFTPKESYVLHSPMALRESFVMSAHNVSSGVALEKLERTVDVIFFWKRLDYSHYGFYRREIGEVVKSLHHSKIPSKSKQNVLMETRVGAAYSDQKEMEEGKLQYEYIAGLLSTKIVVIAQRDEWEDHYRLMESLASGALVLSDPMIAPPAGLKDKVNIVFFSNTTELKKHIRYYLLPKNKEERKRIALEGYKLAMGRHRSWHRIEELLFGEPITNVNRPYAAAPEKKEHPESTYWITDEDGGETNRFL